MVCTPAKRTCSEAEVAPEHASIFDREGVYFAIGGRAFTCSVVSDSTTRSFSNLNCAGIKSNLGLAHTEKTANASLELGDLAGSVALQ